jgi:uncharacterized DUF497 family protein
LSYKAKANLRKHGVSFDEAASVFFDPLALSGDDPDHSADESRFITFGVSSRGRLLTIIHTVRGESIRIISARVRQELKGRSMKKARNSKSDEMRTQYKRSDFKKLERGKFYQRVVAGSNVVALDPKVAKAFPNSAIVNQTLNDLLELARKSSRLKPRPRSKIARAG